MSFVSNGGKFKLYTVLNGLIFQRLLSLGFNLNTRYFCISGNKHEAQTQLKITILKKMYCREQ
jgi:hypothetical protein